mmetsp:Transcript_29975/g.88914  ORF Transcript_29975/g.88914 Transcript_29975/m.88914 type:complete len:232 (+) Transcript_29975:2150-2845(+)|eukprot:364274-Chlamydomonas_euryale.AAC.3
MARPRRAGTGCSFRPAPPLDRCGDTLAGTDSCHSAPTPVSARPEAVSLSACASATAAYAARFALPMRPAEASAGTAVHTQLCMSLVAPSPAAPSCTREGAAADVTSAMATSSSAAPLPPSTVGRTPCSSSPPAAPASVPHQSQSLSIAPTESRPPLVLLPSLPLSAHTPPPTPSWPPHRSTWRASGPPHALETLPSWRGVTAPCGSCASQKSCAWGGVPRGRLAAMRAVSS